jgi:D-lactate dehydrogenase (cytochrome)
MASTRASGTNAVRYGTMRDNVLALKVVRGRRRDHHDRHAGQEILGRLRPDASVRRRRRHARHHHRTHLKLRGIPETIAAAACSFESVRGACQATILTIQSGIPVARIELLDAEQVRPATLFETHAAGDADAAAGIPRHRGERRRAVEEFREIARECGGGDFTWTTRPEDRTKLWQARHDAYWAVKALRPGAGVVATDVCVPISRLADCVAETEATISRLNLRAPIVGHVGDGNFHCSLLAMSTTRRDGARRGFHAPPGGTRAGDGRHLHRRARRRPGQAEIPVGRSTPCAR